MQLTTYKTMQKRRTRALSDSQGSAGLVFLGFLGLVGLVGLGTARIKITTILGSVVPFYLAAALCVALTLFSVGAVFCKHLFAKRARERVFSALGELERLINSSHQILNYYEKQKMDYRYALGNNDIKYLHAARRLLIALEERHKRVFFTAAKEGIFDLRKAHTLFVEPLFVAADPMTTLVSTPPIGPLMPQDWPVMLDNLFKNYERDLSRLHSDVVLRA